MYQLLLRGLGSPASRCMVRTAFRYCRTEEKQRRDARKAMYLPKLAAEIGTGIIPIPLQNCRYTNC